MVLPAQMFIDGYAKVVKAIYKLYRRSVNL